MLLLAVALLAQNVDPPRDTALATYRALIESQVPVTTSDITDRPYRIIAHVQRNVRKATLFSKAASKEKLERELWERGQKVGADAVINARYGDERITGMSWGANKVEGDAVKFLEPSGTDSSKAGALK